MYFIHIHLPSPSFSQIHHPFLSGRPIFVTFLKPIESNLHWPYVPGCVALPVGHGRPTSLKKIDSPPGSSQLPIAPQLMALWSSPSLGWESVWLEFAPALCMLSLLLRVHSHNSPAVSKRTVSLQSCTASGSITLSSPEPPEERRWYRRPAQG